VGAWLRAKRKGILDADGGISMEGSFAAGWGDFLVAASGAAGALAGLLFVSLSINLNRIIDLPGVSGRAAETVIVLAGTLLGALTILIPRQSPAGLGAILLTIGAGTWGIPTALHVDAARRRAYHRAGHLAWRSALHQFATLPFLCAGLSLLGFLRGGLAWFGAGVILSLLVALINAWVLLVEIMR
jgi:hypothetical protein